MWIGILNDDICRYYISNARFLVMSFFEFQAHKLRKKLKKHAIFESTNDYDDVENSASKKDCEHCFFWSNEKRILFDHVFNDSRNERINRIEIETILVVIIINNASSQNRLWNHELTKHWRNCENMQFSKAIFRNMNNCDDDEDSTSKKIAHIALSVLMKTSL